MRQILCTIVGHKIQRHRRFLVLPHRLEQCERCGQHVELQ